MSLGRKIEIEPLAESRWARIERAILDASVTPKAESPWQDSQAMRSGPAWRAAVGLVLAGAAAAALGALTLRLVAFPEDRDAPTRIETGSNGSRVEVGESTVDVGPQSLVRFDGDDTRGIRVLLDQGRIECDVTSRKGRPAFVVEAGGVEVRVVGTHFVVNRADDAVTVSVQRGQVEVNSGSSHTSVPAGAQWLSPQTTTHDSLGQPPPAGTEPTPTGSSHAAPTHGDGRGSAPVHAIAGLTPREQYDAASKLEARQPEAALALYAELAKQGGPWGMNALFAQGRLQADRQHRREASELLQEYLSHYPSGPNAEDARRLIDRLR
jgi:hypothetical protein